MEEIYEYKVSVVTAVYNVERYLEEAIESVIRQTIGIKNIQMILVDDGSSDGSGGICDRYAREYPRNIFVIHKENGGVSSARNEGLKLVKGKYVNFLDSDDKLQFDALEKMYGYLEENRKRIDLVAIPWKFFEARNDDHLLNEKFKITKIVDLQNDYSFIQLAANAILVKAASLANRRFDERLSYAEDAKLVVDVLLDKMAYGVLHNTCYFYRRRETEDSAIDMGRTKKVYYIPYMKFFILESIENALKIKGYIPKFVQYTCMYDLQWRLVQNDMAEKGVLTENEQAEYKKLIIQAIQYIDDDIILQQKALSDDYKTAVFLLKPENREAYEYVKYPDGIKIELNGVALADLSSYESFYEIYKQTDQGIAVEGYISYFSEMKFVYPVLKITVIDSNTGIKYGIVRQQAFELKGDYFDRQGKNTYMLDELITKANGFRFNIPSPQDGMTYKIQLCIRYDNHDIACTNVKFGKFFPLTEKLRKSYFYNNELLLTYNGNELLMHKAYKKEAAGCEADLLKELSSQKDKKVQRGLFARRLYNTLKRFKKREIWLISDRLTKADDNGEALFQYISMYCKNDNIKLYFVLDKESDDYERIKKIGKVIPYHSNACKILSLLCDKIISSQGEDYVFNRFFDMAYIYKDILTQKKFIFLQHGITKDDLCRWLNKYDKNISMFVTTTEAEYNSIVQNNNYYYTKEQIKLTGMPRYDYLYDNSSDKKIITFFPTWRFYLTRDFDIATDKRRLNNGFGNSNFCKMYKSLFSSTLLFESARKHDYTLQIMMHPSMPRECMDYFDCPAEFMILPSDKQYREVYAESRLAVTDYSSAVFDFAYLRKPVIYYQADHEEFFSGAHTYDKGYFDYQKDGFGEVEYTADTLIERLIEYMENDCRLKDKYRERIDRTFPYNDRNNCQRVYNEILKLGKEDGNE